MTKLNYEPFEKEWLIDELEAAFPQYKIQTSWGLLQVRTSGFTITGNVKIAMKPKKGKIVLSTNLDMLIIFFMFCFPIGIYVLAKTKNNEKWKQK